MFFIRYDFDMAESMTRLFFAEKFFSQKEMKNCFRPSLDNDKFQYDRIFSGIELENWAI